ncbi:MAG: hypothetical protein QF645_06810, partial [Planctomycetota bacterium]|nr:hypothetical protein [Planctomycetota bacterium]
MIFASLLYFSALILQEGNEAKDLFEQMVKKMDNAKTLQVEFETMNQRGEEKREASGTLALGAENRMRMELVMASPRGDQKVLILSDGKKTFQIQGSQRREIKTAEGRNELVQQISSRLGVMVGFMFSEPSAKVGDRKKIDEFVTLTDFKMGVSEKVDGREANLVSFLARISIKEDEAAVKVWIDSATGLPLKRSITPYRNGKPSEDEMHETYVKITLDAEIPADHFTIPAEE